MRCAAKDWGNGRFVFPGSGLPATACPAAEVLAPLVGRIQAVAGAPLLPPGTAAGAVALFRASATGDRRMDHIPSCYGHGLANGGALR